MSQLVETSTKVNISRRKIAANLLFLTSSQGLTWILTTLYMLVVPRYIGPDGIGTLSLVAGVASILIVIATLYATLGCTRSRW